MGAYATAVLATAGLVSFWDLDETSGTVAADGKGSNTGTYSGTYTQNQPGQSGQSVLLGGSSGTVKTASVVLTATASVTLECWFRCADITQTTQCLINNGTGSNGYALYVSGNGTTDGTIYGLYNVVRWFGNRTVRTGEWNHIALVINASGKPTIYLNGASIFTDSGSNAVTPTTQTSIGSQGDGTRFFKGQIDGVACYNAALSAATILAHYQAGELAYRGRTALAKPRGIRSVRQPGGGLVACVPMTNPSGLQADLITGAAVGIGGLPAPVVAGRLGVALSSTLGFSQIVTVPHAAVNRQSFTVEAWMMFRSFQPSSPFISAIWADGAATINLRLGDSTLPNDRLEFTGSGILATNRLVLDTPHQFVLTGTASALTAYIDGVLAGTAAAASSSTFTSSQLWTDGAGGRNPDAETYLFNLWNRPLSAQEVMNRYADPWGLFDDANTNHAMAFAGAQAITSQPASLLPAM